MGKRIMVLPIWKAAEAPEGAIVVNTTSRGKADVFRQLSPFHLGPCPLYGGYVAKVMENGWQFSKVYAEHLRRGKPTLDYFRWSQQGWEDEKPHRYPMGKGAKPEFSWWDGRKLSYVEARKRIYVPLYARAVRRTKAYGYLEVIHKEKVLVLLDFDAYDHRAAGMTLTDVLNEPKRKMGHAFVLAMMLRGDKALKQCDV